MGDANTSSQSPSLEKVQEALSDYCREMVEKGAFHSVQELQSHLNTMFSKVIESSL